MTKPNITLRAVKGEPLSVAEMDSNLSNLRDATYTFVADSGSNLVLDLNSSVAIRGGTGVSTTASAGTVTVDLEDTAVVAGSYTKADITVDNQGRVTSASNGDVSINSSDVTTALGYTPEDASNKNAANGYAGLDSSGKVASAQLPSYVDDVEEYADQASFPVTGETGKIYVAIDSSKIYRWTGSVYAEIQASPGSTDDVPEGSTNQYYTNTRARSSISATQNVSYDSGTGVITGPDLSPYLQNITNESLNDLSNVNAASPSEGDTLVYQSGSWVNAAPSGGGGAIQPTVSNLQSTSGTTTLDADTANWFDITPSGGTTLNFSTSSAQAKIDVVINGGSTMRPVGYKFESIQSDNVSNTYLEYDNYMVGIFFKPDGTKFYTVGVQGSPRKIYEYTLNIPWDISTFNPPVTRNMGGTPKDIFFSPDGTRMYTPYSGPYSGGVYQFTLDNPWEINAPGSWQNIAIDCESIFFSPDGLNVFLLDDRLYQHKLTTAWDLKTMVTPPHRTYKLPPAASDARSMFFSPDGKQLVIGNKGPDRLVLFVLSNPWDLAGIQFTGFTTSYTPPPESIYWRPDGEKFYVIFPSALEQFSTTDLEPGAHVVNFPPEVEWQGDNPYAVEENKQFWYQFETANGGSKWLGNIKDEGF